MNDILLLKQGEIVLKGLNRKYFEQRLESNLRRRLKPLGEFKIYTMQSTVYVEPFDDSCDIDAAYEAVQKVFGIVSIARATACEKNKEAIAETALRCLGELVRRAKSFKVETKRADKSFPMTSIQLSQYVGGELNGAYPDTAVDVHNPELVVNVEVRDYLAYVHAEAVQGAGGLPVGCNGNAVTLLSGGIDSPVSSYMIAKRGIHLIPVHFFSFPYTSEQAKEKVIELARILTDYCGKLTVEVVPFTHIQEEIRKNCPEEYFTLIMRRFMMRISEKIALSNGCAALVTGENLGQVASQTMEAIRVTEDVCTLPVLRPLIGMDKLEIIKKAQQIGTFNTSILPFEDCCTIFTPRRPKTKPRLDEVVRVEAKLDVDALVGEALANKERVYLQGV